MTPTVTDWLNEHLWALLAGVIIGALPAPIALGIEMLAFHFGWVR